MAAENDPKPARHTQPSHSQNPANKLYRDPADQGRGDMVSENRAANERFQRNSEKLQQRQAEQNKAPAQQQDNKRGLSFGPGRENRPDQARAKDEITKPAAKDRSAEQSQKKELSFGPGRANRENYSKLRQEHSAAISRNQEQGRGR